VKVVVFNVVARDISSVTARAREAEMIAQVMTLVADVAPAESAVGAVAAATIAIDLKAAEIATIVARNLQTVTDIATANENTATEINAVLEDEATAAV